MSKKQNYKLWGSAFQEAPDNLMLQFTVGHDAYAIPAADSVLIPYDIICNQAHVKMLAKQGIISQSENKVLQDAFAKLLLAYQEGNFQLDPALEDVHTNIENWVAENYGKEIAGKIHTGRSRNDQVVTDIYLYLHDQINNYQVAVADLVNTLEVASQKYQATICPGYTHHQHATVTSFGLILASFKTAFERDLQGFVSLKEKYNYSPLGASIAYGSLIKLDPEFTAKELGFKSKFANPIDVITNRGEFEAAFAFQINQFLNHAANLAETFVLFSTSEFGLIKLADQYSTGSSAMPQKKNPDPLELIKGLACVANGTLSSLLQLTKSNLIGYNRDSQESKYLIYHLILKSLPVAHILSGIVETTTVFSEVMKKQANCGFINSMGLMEIIIEKFHLPMRQTKVLIEKSIKYSLKANAKNKILYPAFQKALSELGINLVITEAKLLLWQDGNFQFKQFS